MLLPNRYLKDKEKGIQEAYISGKMPEKKFNKIKINNMKT